MTLMDLYVVNDAWSSDTSVVICDPTDAYFDCTFSDLADIDSIWLGEVYSFCGNNIMMGQAVEGLDEFSI